MTIAANDARAQTVAPTRISSSTMSTYGRDSAGSAPVTSPRISPTDIAAVTLARTFADASRRSRATIPACLEEIERHARLEPDAGVRGAGQVAAQAGDALEGVGAELGGELRVELAREVEPVIGPQRAGQPRLGRSAAVGPLRRWASPNSRRRC